MRVMLLAPPWGDIYGDFTPAAKVGVAQPPLGLCYLSSHLKHQDHEVCLIDAEAECLNIDGIVRKLEDFEPEVLGIQVVSPLWDIVLEISKVVKSKWDIPIVLGGPHITITQGEAFEQNPYFDYGVIGEGEETMAELVGCLAQGQSADAVTGLVYRQDGSIVQTLPRLSPPDLDGYLFPDRSDLVPDRYFFSVPGKGVRKLTLITSTRGCPYNCTFCTEPMIFGRTTRFRTPTNVVDEIEAVYEQYGITHFVFVDDTLTVQKPRMYEICDQIRSRGLDITMDGWTHANTVDEPLLAAMKKAGFVRLNFGVESGNAEILKSLKKGASLDRIRAAYKAAKKVGLETRGSVMLGLPGETKATVEETIRFVRDLKEIDHCYFHIATPYPGTEIRELALKGERGTRLLSLEYSQLRRIGKSVAMEVNDLTADELIRLQRKAYRSFWLTPRRIYYNLTRAGLSAGLVNGWAFFRSFIMPKKSEQFKFFSEITSLFNRRSKGNLPDLTKVG